MFRPLARLSHAHWRWSQKTTNQVRQMLSWSRQGWHSRGGCRCIGGWTAPVVSRGVGVRGEVKVTPAAPEDHPITLDSLYCSY